MIIQKTGIDTEKMEKAAFMLKAVAHPVKLGIIQLLEKHQTLSVTELGAILNCEQSLLSHHLINMKLKGILSSSKNGQNVMYELKLKAITDLLVCIENCACDF